MHTVPDEYRVARALLSISRDDVIHTLEEGGPEKSLGRIKAELAQKKGVSWDDIPEDVVLAHLEDLEKVPSFIETIGKGQGKKWSIHFMK